jgi:hypothetical protein
MILPLEEAQIQLLLTNEQAKVETVEVVEILSILKGENELVIVD